MAKGYTSQGVARFSVFAINILFFILGVIVLSLSAAGNSYFLNDSAIASALSSLDLPVLTALIIATGCVTVALSLLGAYAAYYQYTRLLKLYLLTLFVVIAIQIAMGIYLLTLNINQTTNQSWNEETTEAQQRRISIQDSLMCCGYRVWTDSIGLLQTPCALAPTSPIISISTFVAPKACQQAIQSFVSKWLLPVAIVAIVLAATEVVSVTLTLYIIFQTSQVRSKTGFKL